jgi:hypothetical protein
MRKGENNLLCPSSRSNVTTRKHSIHAFCTPFDVDMYKLDVEADWVGSFLEANRTRESLKQNHSNNTGDHNSQNTPTEFS